MADFSADIVNGPPVLTLAGMRGSSPRMQIGTQVYGMRGWDPGASAYRSWSVFGSPDYAAAQYTGPGAGTLTGVVVAWQRSILT